MKERLKAIRKHPKINLSQEAFGERVGVKGNTIGNYELGLRNPSNAVIFSICREFNVNEEWLRTGKGNMFNLLPEDDEFVSLANRVAAGTSERDSFCKELFIALSKLSDDELNALKKFIFLMK